MARKATAAMRRRMTKPLRLVQCWGLQRGRATITQGLDANGQVWERRIVLDPNEPGIVVDSWWERISMEIKR